MLKVHADILFATPAYWDERLPSNERSKKQTYRRYLTFDYVCIRSALSLIADVCIPFTLFMLKRWFI